MLVKRSLFITAAAAIALVAFSSTADAAPGDSEFVCVTLWAMYQENIQAHLAIVTPS